ncbi:MAG TPA: RNA 2'-phosphotransferase [Blastocatellia bacterium]|nr:RNA 2'-phosphotransferase [Blastocatellia bacterium]
MSSREVKVSKFLSLVLRHKPEEIGIQLDEAGWTPVDTLLAALNSHGLSITREELEQVVSNNEKKRFAFSDDGRLIRANQGHSVEVELGYTPQTPPEVLYHGTVEKFLPSIKEQGLIKGQRHHVHLSPDRETAIKVGQRRGKPIVIEVDAARMHADGVIFYRSENGVWLTDHVPVQHLVF